MKQQFDVGKEIIAAGLVPIIEPEVDIKTPNKDKAEELLKAAIMKQLNALKPDQRVMLKLTIPDKDNLYADLIKHKNVLRVVALSGGYSRDEANKRLARNNGMTASFSRALAEGLTAQQSDKEFNAALDASVESIYRARSPSTLALDRSSGSARPTTALRRVPPFGCKDHDTKIIYTLTDEAPALATYSLLPIVQAFTQRGRRRRRDARHLAGGPHPRAVSRQR